MYVDLWTSESVPKVIATEARETHRRLCVAERHTYMGPEYLGKSDIKTQDLRSVHVFQSASRSASLFIFVHTASIQ